MKKYILTVGPALLNSVPLTEIHDNKHIYRINGAHGTVADIEGYINKIRSQVANADILIDLPGNKVRVKGEYHLNDGQVIDIPSDCFTYSDYWKLLKPGEVVLANDSVFTLKVQSADSTKVSFLSYSTGILTNGKGMHAKGINKGLPFLFEKDKELIAIANKHKVEYVGLSFVRTRNDIEEARKLIESSRIIAKTETLDAVHNVNDILAAVDYILIDRGDLSTDIGIENIPRFQSYIIDKANYFGKNVFVATQLLKNMETKPIPTIAEIEALYALLKKGVYGIQMSEETAVGHYVKECIDTLNRVNENILKEDVFSEL